MFLTAESDPGKTSGTDRRESQAQFDGVMEPADGNRAAKLPAQETLKNRVPNR
jgi:hypothetical protein